MTLAARVLAGAKGRFAAGALVLFVLAAALAPVLSPYRYDAQDLAIAEQPPSAAHWLGTDEFGRDVATRVVFGARTSLTIAVLSISASLAAGILLGCLAAYYGGLVDTAISFLSDLSWSFPEILLALLLVAITGPGLVGVLVSVSVAYLAQFTRLTRGQVLSLRTETFVEATRSLGAPDWQIMWRHLIPNALAPVIVAGLLAMGDAIVLEATLSFFGLGAQPPTPSWGSMMGGGTALMFLAPWVIIFPGLAMALTVVSLNLFGDALLHALDVRARPRTA